MNKSFCLSIMVISVAIWSFSLVIPERVLAEDALTNYNWYCAQCHGEGGEGDGPNAGKDLPVAPRNLTKKEEMVKFSEEMIFNTLTKGGPANNLSTLMPPFGNILPPDELKALAKLVRTELCKC
ncbi:MAG: cytochrome c [Nitrospinota bacterium]|jgi:mono/diheme cytochrome c family protein|nr:cytochrome C class I [Nitrospinota bacterium]MDP7349731.1 cytochrome c [Nitrospinota bacterium]MDP7579854.1 cytochrome c [Nitrospinota bacterium]HJN01532.1 cytochrome c [Nitrospinota bacterium]